jgi:hypothetical protein
MRYQKVVIVSAADELGMPNWATIGLQAGQWIKYNGAKGRFMGFRNGTVWIAWGSTATKRFATFAKAFKGPPLLA